MFITLHRYRCESFSCQWEGNFRARSRTLAVDGTGARKADVTGIALLEPAHPTPVPKSFILNMVLVVAGVVLV